MSKSFRCNIYKKQGEGGQLLLTRNRGKRSSHASVETTCQWFPTDFRPGKIDKHIGIRKASEMKRIALAAWLSAGLLITGGCKNQPSDNDAIRAGILRHLNGVGTLNMSAMEMEMRTVSVNGNQARAEVIFRPKTGAPPGAGMQVAYQLEKRDSAWVVVKTEAAGGMIEHPAANANPHMQPGADSMHGSLPNFRDMIPPTTPATGGPLPPGHPPIDASAQTT